MVRSPPRLNNLSFNTKRAILSSLVDQLLVVWVVLLPKAQDHYMLESDTRLPANRFQPSYTFPYLIRRQDQQSCSQHHAGSGEKQCGRAQVLVDPARDRPAQQRGQPPAGGVENTLVGSGQVVRRAQIDEGDRADQQQPEAQPAQR